ncbi:MAG: hypothetical protein AB7O46_09860, partial [Xanthobacteraceae bacterium]
GFAPYHGAIFSGLKVKPAFTVDFWAKIIKKSRDLTSLLAKRVRPSLHKTITVRGRDSSGRTEGAGPRPATENAATRSAPRGARNHTANNRDGEKASRVRSRRCRPETGSDADAGTAIQTGSDEDPARPRIRFASPSFAFQSIRDAR